MSASEKVWHGLKLAYAYSGVVAWKLYPYVKRGLRATFRFIREQMSKRKRD